MLPIEPVGMLSPEERSGMSRRERVLAAFLLAIAVVGVALISRLLSTPVTSLSLAIEPGPGRSVVVAPTVAAERRAAPRLVARPADVSAAPVVPAVPVNLEPAAKPSAVHAKQTPAPPSLSTPAGSQHPSSPSPSPAEPSPLAAGHSPGSTLTPAAAPTHGPPPGVKPDLGEHGHDLRGSGHGRPHPQVPPHAVGARDRHLGRVAKTPSRPAPPAPEARSKARPEAGRPRGKGRPAPPLAHHHGPGDKGRHD
jgi:hypothetical protein